MRCSSVIIAFVASIGPAASLSTPASATSESVLYAFSGAPVDGAQVSGGLTYMGGTFYGVTATGGAYQNGVVFSVTPGGVEKVVYAFGAIAHEGINPSGTLLALGGKLYGTTQHGGVHGAGTLFSVTPQGKEVMLHSFGGKGTDGANPIGALIESNGEIYGTTLNGGAYGHGTTFTLDLNAQSARRVAVVTHSFGVDSADGTSPSGGLAPMGDLFYGTTRTGGAHGHGTVFSITPAGRTSIVHSFSGGADGDAPTGALLAVGNVLYGATQYGGKTGVCTTGCGTVFSLTKAGVAKTLHAFNGGHEGFSPLGSLIKVGQGLFGVTSGQFQSASGMHNNGSVFRVSLTGYTTVPHAFTNGPDGANPAGPLVVLNGELYGTTAYGGMPVGTGYYSGGTVYKVDR